MRNRKQYRKVDSVPVINQWNDAEGTLLFVMLAFFCNCLFIIYLTQGASTGFQQKLLYTL